MKINVYDKAGKVKEEIDFILAEKGSSYKDLLVQYIKVFQINQRQGNANVKTRSDVSGGGKKPWRQKGTGRARVGSNRSPLWVGGGTIHGPVSKNWQAKMSKTMKQNALKGAIRVHSNSKSISVFDFSTFSGDKVSTKSANDFLSNTKLNQKTLLIHAGNNNLYLSFRNLPHIMLTDVGNLNAFEVISAKHLLIEKSAVERFIEKAN